MLTWIAVAMGAGGQAVLDGSIVDHLVADVDGDGRIEGVTVSSSVEDGFLVRVGHDGCVPGGYGPGATPLSGPRLRRIDQERAGIPLLEVQAEDDAGIRTWLLHVDRVEGHDPDRRCSRIRKVYEWHRLRDDGLVVQDPEVAFDAADGTVTATVASWSAQGWTTTVEVSLWDATLRSYVPIETWEVGSTPEQARICDSW